MKRKALLISGAEARFQRDVATLASYLDGIGCETEVLVLGTHWIKNCWNIWKIARKIKADELFLFLYNGHGQPEGWERAIPYWAITACLRQVKGRMLVVNDTCYGLHLLPRLKDFRSEDTTSFISPWDSEDISYGGPLRDILDYWPKGKMVEEVVTGQIYSSDKGDIEVPIQIRWGAQFDQHFFPD